MVVSEQWGHRPGLVGVVVRVPVGARPSARSQSISRRSCWTSPRLVQARAQLVMKLLYMSISAPATASVTPVMKMVTVVR